MCTDLLKQSNFGLKILDGDLRDRFKIIWGESGTGKSASIPFLYPNCYKKQKGTEKWDLYDIKDPGHDVVWIDEFSKETLETFAGKNSGGFEFLKELCDRYPVTVDEKYTHSFKIRPKKIFITMNEHPSTLLPDRAIAVNTRAMERRFEYIDGREWLLRNNLRLKYKNGKPDGVEKIPEDSYESSIDLIGN